MELPEAGSNVIVVRKGLSYEGLMIPSTEKEIVMLKLRNGYNVGFKASEIEIKTVGKKETLERFPETTVRARGKPKVALITTGGTITSRIDYKTGAVRSLTKTEQLLFNIPELNKIVDLKLFAPFAIMSEDMTPVEWQKIAEVVLRELKKNDGVIVTHGTDTLHYTAAALSFMIQGLNRPVALVGGQRSSDRGSFDGAQNLICAAHFATSNIAEVAVVMHANSADDFCYAIRGTKVRKMHTSRRDAFRPINELPIAKIWPNGKIEHMNGHKKTGNAKLTLKSGFETKIALIKVFPGESPDIIDFYTENGYKGIIFEGTGLGHVPTKLIEAVKRAISKGIFVGVTSQCIYGRTDPFVYSAGRMLKEAGAVHLSDMLSDTAYVKLGWVLAQTKDQEQVKELMLKNIAGEINPRTIEKAYLF